MSKWVCLATVEGEVEKTQLQSLLRSEKIKSVVQDLENSEFLRVYMGTTQGRSEILVSERDLPKAKDLLQAFDYQVE